MKIIYQGKEVGLQKNIKKVIDMEFLQSMLSHANLTMKLSH